MSDLIDKAEALAAIAALSKEFLEGGSPTAVKVLNLAADRLNALPARGVGVTWHPFDTAPRDGSRFLAQGGGLDAIDICSYNARVGCWDCGAVTLDDTDHEPEGYNRPAQWVPLAALAPTDAAQAREAAIRDFVLREALAAVNKAREAVIHSGNRAYIDGISVGHDRAEIAILALLSEART